MLKPLALVCAENMIVGNQLVTRLQDLDYRVQVAGEAGQLPVLAASCKPFVIITDLVSRGQDRLEIIRQLRAGEATRHIPVLGMTADSSQEFHTQAMEAGATLVAVESGMLAQLPQLLEAALAVE